MKRIFFFAVVGMLTMFSITSCEDDNTTAEPKSFKVRMTDSPGNYTALNMTITGVDAYCEGYGWVALSSQAQSVNMASLTNGSEVTLANKSDIQAGHYTHIRVKYASAATVTVNASGTGFGLNFSLSWGSFPQETDIVIDQHVSNNIGANFLLDFNVAQSVIQVGSGYQINPVITVIHDEKTGVKGHITGASSAAVVLTGNGKTYSGYMNSSGYFLIRGMTSGTYTAIIFKNSDTNESHQINNVVVANGQIYSMGEIQL